MSAMSQAAWDMAARAADRIVGRRAHPTVVRGVLAQWIAENGYHWPPPRNNPGNVARKWAAPLGLPFTVHFPNPQPGNPIVTFATAAAGADAYAAGLVAYPRYSRAVQLARAGDGLGFAVGVCRAGYGTRESAVRTVYAALQAPASPGPGPTPGGSNVAIRYAHVPTGGPRFRLAPTQILYDRPGGVRATAMAKAADVPYVGQAGAASGIAWVAVVVGTAWSYPDGRPHSTVLYVPARAGEVIAP